MFDIGWGELLVIAIVALVVIGPKELPGTLRTVGQLMAKVRRMAGDFQHQFQEAMREAELSDLKKEVDEMAQKAANFTEFDPVADVRREFEDAQRQVESAVTDPLPPQQTQTPAETTPAPEPSARLGEAEPLKPDAGGRPA